MTEPRRFNRSWLIVIVVVAVMVAFYVLGYVAVKTR